MGQAGFWGRVPEAASSLCMAPCSQKECSQRFLSWTPDPRMAPRGMEEVASTPAPGPVTTSPTPNNCRDPEMREATRQGRLDWTLGTENRAGLLSSLGPRGLYTVYWGARQQADGQGGM